MRDCDYSTASEFLARFFAHTIGAVEIRALPNDRMAGRAAPLFTREPAMVEAHCTRWDAVDRAVFFGVCTRLTGAPSGSRADLAELIALWVDIDTGKLGLDKGEVIAALRAMPMPPSRIVDSGGGLHAYWLLKEPIDVRQGVISSDDEEAIIAVLRQLAGVTAGDTAVCDLARVMRLPGTHNTKTGELRLVEVLEATDARYEFSDIQDMLDTQRPVVIRPKNSAEKFPAEFPAEKDPFLAAAERFGFKAPIDVEQRLAEMTYLGIGDTGVHQTQLSVSASLASQGVPDEQIVKLLLEATQHAVGLAGEHWNWKREEKAIAAMVASAKKKFPPKPARQPPEHKRPETAAEEHPQAVGGGTVVNLSEERKARAKASSRDDREPLIPQIGDAAIHYWREQRGHIAVVGGTPYTYSGGMWTAWLPADHHALRSVIQGVIEARKLDPKTQLLNAVYRYVMERPGLIRESVIFDASGLIVCCDGAINPLTRAVCQHSPDHWATCRAEINISDMGQGCPQWLYFLDSSFSDLPVSERALVIETLAEWFGAALVRGKPRELRKALWAYGESRTGKSRLSEVLRLLVGDPTSAIKVRALEKNFGPAALLGMRGWIADDAVGSSDEIDDAIFKVVVTGEAFSTDVKNGAYATKRLEIPVLLTSNPLPRVKDQSDAIYNRSLMMHMRVVRSEEETAGQTPIDEIVRDNELAGVFSWALDGWVRLLRRGRFIPPVSMTGSLAEFKSSNNVVGSWAKEAIVADSMYMVDRRDLYASFKGWYAAEFGEAAKVPSPKFLIGALRQQMTIGPDHKRTGYRYMTCLRLTDDGLLYRKESSREFGVAPGSGCSESDVNAPRPWQETDAENALRSTKEPPF